MASDPERRSCRFRPGRGSGAWEHLGFGKSFPDRPVAHSNTSGVDIPLRSVDVQLAELVARARSLRASTKVVGLPGGLFLDLHSPTVYH